MSEFGVDTGYDWWVEGSGWKVRGTKFVPDTAELTSLVDEYMSAENRKAAAIKESVDIQNKLRAAVINCGGPFLVRSGDGLILVSHEDGTVKLAKVIDATGGKA